MSVVLGAISSVLFIVVAVTLVYKYRQSRQAGFLWLAVPLVLFPLLGLPMTHWIKGSVNALTGQESNVAFPFSLVESGRMTLGGLLALIQTTQHVLWTAFILVGLLMLNRPQHEKAN